MYKTYKYISTSISFHISHNIRSVCPLYSLKKEEKSNNRLASSHTFPVTLESLCCRWMKWNDATLANFEVFFFFFFFFFFFISVIQFFKFLEKKNNNKNAILPPLQLTMTEDSAENS